MNRTCTGDALVITIPTGRGELRTTGEQVVVVPLRSSEDPRAVFRASVYGFTDGLTLHPRASPLETGCPWRVLTGITRVPVSEPAATAIRRSSSAAPLRHVGPGANQPYLVRRDQPYRVWRDQEPNEFPWAILTAHDGERVTRAALRDHFMGWHDGQSRRTAFVLEWGQVP